MMGETISHYRIIEKLGAGGMSVINRSENTGNGRRPLFAILTYLMIYLPI